MDDTTSPPSRSSQTADTLPRVHRRPDTEATGIDSVVQFPFHGTCPKCKHFHQNWPFAISADVNDHTRLKCERCRRDMFGLGRTDTQATLASIESLPLSQLDTRSAPDVGACSDVLRPLPREEQGGPAHNSAQDTGVPSLVDSKSQEHSQSPNAEETSSVAQTHRTINICESPTNLTTGSPSQNITPLYMQALQALPYHQTLFGALGYANIFGERLRDRYFGRPREYTLLGLRFSIHHVHPPTAHAADADAISTTASHPPEDIIPTSHAYIAMAPTDDHNRACTQAEAATNPLPATYFTAASSTGSFHLNRPEARMDNNTIDANRRRSRLAQIRHEKTLAMNALRQLNCNCTTSCHCTPQAIRAPHDAHDDHGSRSRTTSSSLNTADVPSHPLGPRFPGQRYLSFIHLGSHLNLYRAEDHGNDTLSQASTVGSGSIVSSVSLHPHRPTLIGRSHSMPAIA